MPNQVLERLVHEREQNHEAIEHVLSAVQEEERDPSEAERELIQRHRSRLEALEPQIVELVELEEQRGASRDARAVLERRGSDGEGEQHRTVAPTAPAQAGEPVYRTFAQYARDELVRRFDVISSRAGGPAERDRAAERLTRAVANTITTDVPGLLPPQHLSQILEVIDKSRPLVQVSRKAPLTSGKVTYPRITGRPVVGVQAVEKTEVASAKMQVALETADAKVFAGAGDLSWQAINWTTPDALALYFDLMAEAYAQATEDETADVIGLTGFTAGPTPATDDLAGWYAAIAAAAGQVYTDTKRPANAILASVPIGFRLLGLVSNTAPTFGPSGSINLTGSGNVAGLQLVVSRGFTDPDVVYVADANQILTAESPGAPVELRAVEPSLAGMEVGVVGGFLAERLDPKAFVKLTPPVAGAGHSASASKSKS